MLACLVDFSTFRSTPFQYLNIFYNSTKHVNSLCTVTNLNSNTSFPKYPK